MQKLLALVLSGSILLSSVSPAWSQARGVRAIQGLHPATKATARGVSSQLFSGVNRRVYAQLAFANSTVQAQLTAGQVSGLARYMLTRPSMEKAKLLRNDFVSLSLIPQAVSLSQRAEAGTLLSNQLKAQFAELKNYGNPAAANVTEMLQSAQLTVVQEILADASALAQIGTAEQAPVLLAFYEQAQGTVWEDTAALITARGLLQMKAYEPLSKFLEQNQHKEILAGTAAYIHMKGLPVNVPTELTLLSIPAANEQLAAFLSTPFALNALHADPSVEATRDWLNLHTQFSAQTENSLSLQPARTNTTTPTVEEEFPLASIQQPEVLTPTPLDVPASVAPLQPATAVQQAPVSDAPLPTTRTARPTSSSGIVYSGIPVFAMMDVSKRALAWIRQKWGKKQKEAAPYEEPGLHDNNTRPVLAQVDLPSRATVGGDLAGVDSGIREVSVGVDGFKLTIEGANNVEHILHNVDLTVSADLKNFSTDYNRLTLNKNYIFELRNQTIPAKQPDHFFFALSTQNGEFEALVQGTKALQLARPMRIKIQKTGAPKKTVTVAVVDSQLGETELVAEVDKSLLVGIKNPETGRVWYNGHTLVFQEENGTITALKDAFVRLPKAESKYWTQILKMYPQMPFHLMVLSTKGKMVPVTYLVPSLQIGLGKTLAPELHGTFGVDKETASNIMMSINNVLPALMIFVHPLMKQYGEAAVFRVGASMFSLGGIIALASGLYGHVGGGVVTNVQFAGFIASSILIALGTSVTRFVQNLLMSANRGILPQVNSFEKQKETVQQKPVEYNARHLAQRAWEVLTKKSTKSLRDVVYYQLGAMFKNLGTMLFLSFPYLANTVGKAFGADLGLDFSASYVPYTLYSLYTLRQVYKTRYKDAFPLNKTVLANNLQDLQNSTAVDIAKVSPADLTADHPVLVGAAKQLKGAIDALVPVEARAQKVGINGLTLKHEKEVGEELENLLLLAGRTPQEAGTARAYLQQNFDVLGRRDVKWYKVAVMTGLPPALAAMTLATFGELGFSNGLAFAMREIMGAARGTAATGALLYGCMFGWRFIGNILSQRMSGGSMYALSSLASVLGPSLAALAVPTGNLGLLITGTVVACFGISNFFSQMYEYMIGLYPKYKREIALLINFTMPLAALPVGAMKSGAFESMPGLDMALCGAALAASVMLTPGMLANSSIVHTFKNWWGKLIKKLKRPFGGNQLPPAAEAPAQ